MVEKRITIFFLILIVLVLLLPACGYQLAGRGTFLPKHIKKIGIPMFDNQTARADLERNLTESIQEEFITRGNYHIVSSEEGVDAVLKGEILSYSLIPRSADEEGRATSYSVIIRASVYFKDLVRDQVIWENPNYVFREDFQISENIQDYYDQEIEAINLSVESFARNIVSTILEGF
ncbi:hypothetical protein CEE39_05880 [bacterium (candidate division B38) B3_B38]|nr:MAG: hypothetical protein CEE39_05880 [bacterium (candidate division B38) B3_B38]